MFDNSVVSLLRSALHRSVKFNWQLIIKKEVEQTESHLSLASKKFSQAILNIGYVLLLFVVRVMIKNSSKSTVSCSRPHCDRSVLNKSMFGPSAFKDSISSPLKLLTPRFPSGNPFWSAMQVDSSATACGCDLLNPCESFEALLRISTDVESPLSPFSWFLKRFSWNLAPDLSFFSLY